MTYAYPAKFSRDESGRVSSSLLIFHEPATDGTDMGEAMSDAGPHNWCL
jgi:hypothetical protein